MKIETTIKDFPEKIKDLDMPPDTRILVVFHEKHPDTDSVDSDEKKMRLRKEKRNKIFDLMGRMNGDESSDEWIKIIQSSRTSSALKSLDICAGSAESAN